jgi:hypothetical protein
MTIIGKHRAKNLSRKGWGFELPCALYLLEGDMQNLANITISSSALPARPVSMLDNLGEQLRAGRITGPMAELIDDLSERRENDPQGWPAHVQACLGHPVCGLLYQDPFTHRAFAKPRGYAGDAVMMDYIYGLGEAEQAARDATPLGLEIFRYLGTQPAPSAVRDRRRLIAGLIDRVSDGGGDSVLAIAAGHLREVELSTAIRHAKLREFVALDQDEASLSVVDRDYAHLGVTAVPGSVRQILAGNVNLGRYDLVYAAGLFDYLNDATAAAFTRRMFDMTRPGGLMLIPNFLAGIRDAGYMEAIMDWRLIYRDHAGMRAMAAALPPDAVADCRIFDDRHEAITYLLVRKAA